MLEPKASQVPKLNVPKYVMETGGDISNVLANLLKANKKSAILSPNKMAKSLTNLHVMTTPDLMLKNNIFIAQKNRLKI